MKLVAVGSLWPGDRILFNREMQAVTVVNLRPGDSPGGASTIIEVVDDDGLGSHYFRFDNECVWKVGP